MISSLGLVLAVVASVARAETFVFSVGGLRLSSDYALLPRVIRAKTGDTISFMFQANELGVTGNHSIVQTSAEKPCTPLEGGFSSPTFAVVPGTTFNILIDDDTQPIYFACGSTNEDHTDDHCQQGEVGVINPRPEDLDTTDEFDAASLVAQAEAAAHDGAMESVRTGGSPLGSGVGARVLGTFPPRVTSEVPGNAAPSSSNAVPLVEPTASSSASVSSSSSSLSTGAIVGIALGALALLALVAGVIARGVLVKKRKAKTETFAGKVERTLGRDGAMVEAKKPQPTLEV